MKNESAIHNINLQLKTGIELAIKKQFEQSATILKDVQKKALETKAYPDYTMASAHLGGLYYVTGRVEEGIQLMKNIIEEYEAVVPNWDYGVITCKQNLLVIETQRNGNFAKGIPIISQYYKDLLGNENSLRKEIEKGRLKALLATCYVHAHQPNKSLEALAEALEILEHIKGEDVEVAELLSNAHYQKGTIQYKIGDYYECLKYLHKAEYVNNTMLKADNINSTTLFSVIGSVYFKVRNFKLAEIYFNKAKKLIEDIGYTDVGFGNVYISLAYINHTKNNKKRATQLIEYVIQKYKGKFDHHPDVGYALDMLATINKLELNAEKCISYRKQALALYETNITSQLKVVVTSVKLINDFIDFGQLTNAKEWIDKIETLLTHNFTDIDSDNDRLSVTFQYYYYWLIFYVAKCSWQYAKYEDSKSVNDLKDANDACTKGMKVFELTRKNFKNIQTLYSIADDTQRLFNIAIKTCATLSKDKNDTSFIQECFKFSEWNKSFQLLLQLNQKAANTQLPAKISNKEKELNASIQRLESLITAETSKEEPDTVKLQTLQNKSELLNNEKEALVDRISKLNPNYFNWKYQTKTVNITQLQQVLQPDEMLIEYFSTDEYIYIFAITQNNIELVKQKVEVDLQEQVLNFNRLLQGLLIYKIAQAGIALYDLLIKPIEHLLKQVAALKIIPDNQLAQLPFEALITKKPETLLPQQLPYLIVSHRISYHYSASLYHNGKANAGKKNNYTKQFGGFAPVYKSKQIDKQTELQNEMALRVSQSNDELNELVYSETEVKSVASLFEKEEADVFLHEQATVKNFIQYANQYQYLLIAAHHIYNNILPENSGILFAPFKTEPNKNVSEHIDWTCLDNTTFKDAIESQQMLFEADAYGLNVKANLVVLSCCETGLGKEITGEGIMGINRGFLFAGAKNIIYTLFKVYDKQSSQFSFYLFDNIINHQQAYDEAIQNAKLKMIDDELSLPKDWAGYVLMGC